MEFDQIEQIEGLDLENKPDLNQIDLKDSIEIDDRKRKNNDDEDEVKIQEKKGFFQMIYDNIGSFLFDYHTDIYTNLKDRRIGNFQVIFQLLISFLIISLVIIPNEMYLEREESESNVYLKTLGTTYGNLNNKLYMWDDANSENPNVAVNSIFLPTRVKITYNQVRGECPTLDLPCIEDSQCVEQELPNIMEMTLCEDAVEIFDVKNISISAILRGCMAQQWCPAENSLAKTTLITELVGQTHKRIHFRSVINFPVLDQYRQFSTFEDNQYVEYPMYGTNIITLKDILLLANLDYEEIRFYGGIIIVKLFWQCDLDSLNPCKPSIVAEKIDTIDNRGYAVRHAIYQIDNLEQRTLKNYQGIMLKFISKGIAYKFSIEKCILILLILVGVQSFIASVIHFVLFKIFGEKKHYSSQVITKLRKDQFNL